MQIDQRTRTRRPREHSYVKILTLRCLAVKHRWCKPSEVVQAVVEASGAEYRSDRGREVYRFLHDWTDDGYAVLREAGGGAMYKRYEICITEPGLEYINQIMPIEHYETNEFPSHTGELNTADYAFIHSQMKADYLYTLQRLAEEPDGVWCAPVVVRSHFGTRINTTTMFYEMTALGIVDQAEWSRNTKPSYRYKINSIGIGYLQYLQSLNQSGG
jgi:hypothetical protein